MAENDQGKRLPWMKFYPADWQADEGLGQCSLAARGLWMELLAIMHKAPVIGHLLIAGKTPTGAQIAIQVKSDAKTIEKCMKELEEWGVFSRTDDGVIFSRRMVADAEKADRDRNNGKGGGNPNLRKKTTKGVNPQDNPEVNTTNNPEDNGGDKAQKLEARSQSLEASSLRSEAASAREEISASPPPKPAMPARNDPPGRWHSLADSFEIDRNGTKRAVVGGSYLDAAANAVCEAAQIRQEDWRGDWRPLIDWLRAGIDCDQTIVPAINRVSSRANYQAPGSLKYFDSAVRQAHAGAA